MPKDQYVNIINNTANSTILSQGMFQKAKTRCWLCKSQLGSVAENTNSLWDNWNMAMFCFLTKENTLGLDYIKRIIDTNPSNTKITWIKEMLLKCNRLLSPGTDLYQYVVNSIIDKRSYFSKKSNLGKLQEWYNLEIPLWKE